LYIITARLSRRSAAAAVLILAAVICAVILIVPDKEAYEYTSAAVDEAPERKQLLFSLGYEAEEISEKEIRIPTVFDEVYSSYNELQQECGYDLSNYKGKKCTLYTFSVSNYPGHDQVLADLIVYKGKVIGGGVYTAAVDGFMHGLRPVK